MWEAHRSWKDFKRHKREPFIGPPKGRPATMEALVTVDRNDYECVFRCVDRRTNVLSGPLSFFPVFSLCSNLENDQFSITDVRLCRNVIVTGCGRAVGRNRRPFTTAAWKWVVSYVMMGERKINYPVVRSWYYNLIFISITRRLWWQLNLHFVK